MNNDSQQTAFRPRRWAAPLLGAFVALGGVATWWVARAADREMRARLLTEAGMIGKAVNARRVLSLTGSAADLANADYQRIKEQLTLVRSANLACRFIYLMGRRPDGTIFFFVDSEPPESKDYSPPGQNYDKVSAGVVRVFATGQPSTDGPIADRWGNWVSGLIPLADPQTKKPFAVLGMDVDARDWNRGIAAHCIAPVSVTAIVLLLLGAFVLLQNRTVLKTQRLAAAEEKYRALFESSSDAVMTVEPPSWRFTSGNPATVKMFRAANEQDFTAREPWALSPERQPDGRASADKAMEMIETAMREGSHFFEWTHARIGGEEFPATVLLTRMEVGGKAFLQATVRDITAQKKAEAALNRAAEEWRETFDAMDAYVTILDSDCRVVRANRAVRQAFAGKQVIGAHCYPLIHGTESRPGDCVSLTAFATGEPRYAERQEPHLGNRWFDVSAFPIKDADGTVSRVVHIMRDITKRKAAEELQRQMDAQLRQQQKLASIGTLAHGMAHEINNPLNGIMNYAELIKDKAADNAPLAAFAHEILTESRRMATMTHSLLSFTEQAQHRQSVAPSSPADLVAAVLPPATEAARQRGIDLSCHIPADLPTASCHRDRIGQAVMALLTNAMEALGEDRPEGHRAKTIRLIARRLDKEGRAWLRLTVEDNGPGIPEKIRERVFDPFFTTKDRTRHSGLGLWISRSIVQEHGGETTLEREDGQWTRFHLDLPVERTRSSEV